MVEVGRQVRQWGRGRGRPSPLATSLVEAKNNTVTADMTSTTAAAARAMVAELIAILVWHRGAQCRVAPKGALVDGKRRRGRPHAATIVLAEISAVVTARIPPRSRGSSGSSRGRKR